MILGLAASSPSSLVEFIKIDAYFLDELKEFKGVRRSFRKGWSCEDVEFEKTLLQEISSIFNIF